MDTTIQGIADLMTGAVLRQTLDVQEGLPDGVLQLFERAVHCSLYECWYGLFQPEGSDRHLFSCAGLRASYWEPAELVPELAHLQHQAQPREMAMHLASWVRNSEIEDIHAAGHITDAQMAQFNPAVRSAIYSVLVAMDMAGKDDACIDFLAEAEGFAPERPPTLRHGRRSVREVADQVRQAQDEAFLAAMPPCGS